MALGRGGRISQCPIADGFAALNELDDAALPPPFKIEVNYGNEEQAGEEDGEISPRQLSTSCSKPDKSTLAEKESDERGVDEEGRKGEVEGTGSKRQTLDSFSPSLSPSHLDQSKKRTLPVTATRGSTFTSAASPFLPSPTSMRHAASAPLFRPSVNTSPYSPSSHIFPPSPVGSISSSPRALGKGKEMSIRDRERDNELDKMAWGTPRMSHCIPAAQGTSSSSSSSSSFIRTGSATSMSDSREREKYWDRERDGAEEFLSLNVPSTNPEDTLDHYEEDDQSGFVSLPCALHCIASTAAYRPRAFSVILHCTASLLSYPVLYRTALHCTVLYCAVLYCTVLYCTVLYCTVLYCTVLYCIVLFCPQPSHYSTQGLDSFSVHSVSASGSDNDIESSSFILESSLGEVSSNGTD